jgi:hypothetical protein
MLSRVVIKLIPPTRLDNPAKCIEKINKSMELSSSPKLKGAYRVQPEPVPFS